MLFTGSLGLLGQGGKGGSIVDRQLGEHLAVQVDASLLQAVHKLGIVHAVQLAGGGNTGDHRRRKSRFFCLRQCKHSCRISLRPVSAILKRLLFAPK